MKLFDRMKTRRSGNSPLPSLEAGTMHGAQWLLNKYQLNE